MFLNKSIWFLLRQSKNILKKTKFVLENYLKLI